MDELKLENEKADKLTQERVKRDKIMSENNFVLVEAGSFEMGDEVSKQYSVTLTEDFFISKYQLTFAEYDEFCNDEGIEKPDEVGWGRDDRPAINVSSFEAIEYCNWRSRKEGLEEVYDINEDNTIYDLKKNGYRLPTEAEWEFAAKGGTLTSLNNSQKYAGGDNINDFAWYDKNSGDEVKKGFIFKKIVIENPRTQPVGKKLPNELGIHDMSGNVWEWCNDWYEDYPSGSMTNPKGPSSGSDRVRRGGSWNGNASYCKVSNRSYDSPSYGGDYIGFRVTRTR